MSRSILPRRAVLGAGAAALAGQPFAALAQAAAGGDFSVWLQALRAEAAAAGVSARTLDVALAGISPIARIIELDRRQPEGRLTFAQYRTNVVSQRRIRDGRARLARHRAILDQVAEAYDVPARVIVALWGIETSYGGFTGGFGVIEALATLAHDGRRSAFFRKELIAALQIIDEGHIAAGDMKGSWAGAMGQSQFMPTSFQQWAVDHDGDGRRDIWNTLPDVFASAANYLKFHGWDGEFIWGRAVRLPPGFDEAQADLDVRKPIGEWQAIGVRRPGGADLPSADIPASIVAPDGLSGQTFMVYDNFRVIMDWNRSTYFALSVGLLSDAIGV